MRMTEPENKVTETETVSSKLSHSNTEQALDYLTKSLQEGSGYETVRLFLEEQAHNLLPRGGEILEWLTNKIGGKATKQLVAAVAGLRCLNCEKGLLPCDACADGGRLGYDMICEPCLGFGEVPCDFCGGTAQASIDFIPAGLRLPVFAVRLGNGEKRIGELLNCHIEPVSKEHAGRTFDECVALLFDLNSQISVLESAVGVAKDMVEVPRKLRKRVSGVIHQSLRLATKGEARLVEIVETMVLASKLQRDYAEEGSKTGRLAAARVEFFGSLLTAMPRFAGTYLEHPLLNEAAKRLAANKGSQHISQGMA